MSKEQDAFNNFIEISKAETIEFLSQMDFDAIKKAGDIIIDAKKKGFRLHVSGIGKPAHIAGYAASLISSTGTPTYFLHGTEAVHGSCGQLVPGDVVIFISNSGETAEMKATVTAIKNNGCQVIGIAGNPQSWLAKESAAFLFAGVKQEGGPLNRAPRMSIIAESFVLQALSLYLQVERGLDPKQYVKWHPGGALGHLRENEK
ncbi:MAG: SIS domain-containing protein [Treponema sp.]|nr:SIS domain-containing protein [Treponema sp.]